jgi:hypothetical protein
LKGAQYACRIQRRRHPFRSQMTTRFGLPEKVVNFDRNQRSFCSEITGQLFPKWVVNNLRNPHLGTLASFLAS